MIELIQIIAIFLEGIISFFSPCVIPLIPLYMSYLANNAKEIDKNGNITYKKKIVIIYTLFFILGLSLSFIILGLSFTSLGFFFKENRKIFLELGGIVIIILGFFQLGIIKLEFLNKEKKIKINFDPNKMTKRTAFLMGFLFSFAWTPCVGPALSSTLIMASTASSVLIGNLFVLIYSLGFLLPFIVLGLFTTKVLNIIRKKQNILNYIVKCGAIIIIAMGIYVTYMGFSIEKTSKETTITTTGKVELSSVVNFTLNDQQDNKHTLEDYMGKTIVLHFYAIDCFSCLEELPNIQKLYNDYNQNKEDVIILSIANVSRNTKTQIKKFLKENNYTFTTLMATNKLFNKYYVTTYPNTYIINKKGNIAFTSFGSLNYETLKTQIDNVNQ